MPAHLVYPSLFLLLQQDFDGDKGKGMWVKGFSTKKEMKRKKTEARICGVCYVCYMFAAGVCKGWVFCKEMRGREKQRGYGLTKK